MTMDESSTSVEQLEEQLAIRWYNIARACWPDSEIKAMIKEGTPIHVLATRCGLSTSAMEVELQRRRTGIADLERKYRAPAAEKPLYEEDLED